MDDEDRLYLAPRNSVWEPRGSERGHNGQGRLVLARLVWPSGVMIVPARLLWVDESAVQVEWVRGSVVRRSWLHGHDVAQWLQG